MELQVSWNLMGVFDVGVQVQRQGFGEGLGETIAKAATAETLGAVDLEVKKVVAADQISGGC